METDYSNEEKGPLLSICVPTYNRSKTLKICLASIMEQVRGYEDDVEVIVSDNCSSDDTREVVGWAQELGPIKYNRNESNIGGGLNFFLLTNQLARGEYCWLIGDDDFLRKDSLSRLLRVMKENPAVDMYHTNAMHLQLSNLEKKMKGVVSSAQFPDDLETESIDFNDREMRSIDELIDPKIDSCFLSAVMCSIFRREIWLEHSSKVEVSKNDFRDAKTTYPHAVILAMAMRGRRVYHFGNPLIVVGDGSRTWNVEYPMVAHIRLLQLLDIYESLGIDQKQIRKCRGNVLLNTVPRIVFLSIKNDGGCRDYVDYKKSINRYMTYKEFWLSFVLSLFVRRVFKLKCRLIYPGYDRIMTNFTGFRI
jgi:glycosyltransferase involved in cell wall biosynthesis